MNGNGALTQITGELASSAGSALGGRSEKAARGNPGKDCLQSRAGTLISHLDGFLDCGK